MGIFDYWGAAGIGGWGDSLAQHQRRIQGQGDRYREQGLQRALAEQQQYEATTITTDLTSYGCDTTTLNNDFASSELVVSPGAVGRFHNLPEGSLIPNYSILQQLRASISDWLEDALTV